MATGLALTIGLNAVDPKHYGRWSGELYACEADAIEMTEIAKSRDFVVEKLLTAEATRAKVMGEITRASKSLKAGDIFLLTYSGHGGQVPDRNNDEDDYQYETWCLYDQELIDDELYYLLGAFKEGVRILVFSDSCHSGTVTCNNRPRQDGAGGVRTPRGEAAGPGLWDDRVRHERRPADRPRRGREEGDGRLL